MSKSRRNVRFPHRSGNSELRRLSVSDASDAVPEPRSPSKDGDNSVAAVLNEVSDYYTLLDYHRFPSPCCMLSCWLTFPGEETAATCPVRLREEETSFHHTYNMDICYDRRLLSCPIFWSHLYNCHRNRGADRLLQGGYRHCQRSQQGEESPFHQVSELVFSCDDHVFSVWRERDLLLQTHSSRG